MKQARMGFVRGFIVIIILAANSAPVRGQTAVGLNKDSLRRLLTSLPDDTIKVNNFIALGQQYENNTPDSAIFYYQQANRLSTRLNYPVGIIRYINNYTAVLNLQGKFE